MSAPYISSRAFISAAYRAFIALIFLLVLSSALRTVRLSPLYFFSCFHQRCVPCVYRPYISSRAFISAAYRAFIALIFLLVLSSALRTVRLSPLYFFSCFHQRCVPCVYRPYISSRAFISAAYRAFIALIFLLVLSSALRTVRLS